jgi:hypothetical protein
MFSVFLAEELQLAANTVSSSMSALAYHFHCRLSTTTAFTDPVLRATKRALHLNPDHQPRTKKQALPATLNMVETLVRQFSTELTNLPNILVATALIMAFCCLLRPSEYCLTRQDKHVIRAENVLFEVIQNGFVSFRNATEMDGIPIKNVQLVKIIMSSAKNISYRMGHTMWFTAASTDKDCINFCSALVWWAQHANLLQKDYFLSFRPKSGAASQILSYRAFGTHIKTLARQFQLDPSFFSCYSLRVGGGPPYYALQARQTALLC